MKRDLVMFLSGVAYCLWTMFVLGFFSGSQVPPTQTTLELGQFPSEALLVAWHGGIGRYRRHGYRLADMPTATQDFVNRVIQHTAR